MLVVSVLSPSQLLPHFPVVPGSLESGHGFTCVPTCPSITVMPPPQHAKHRMAPDGPFAGGSAAAT